MRSPGMRCQSKLLRALSCAAIAGMILGTASCKATPSSSPAGKSATPPSAKVTNTYPCPSKSSATSAPVMNGPVFNDPRVDGKRASIFNQFTSLANSVPSGGSIWMSMHEIDIQNCKDVEKNLFDSLIAAAERKVTVRILVDGEVTRESKAAYDRLSAGINGHPGSWVHACPVGRGCIGKNLNHNKYALFSQVKLNGKIYKNVIFQSSSNFTDYYLTQSFNDSYTLSDTSGKLYHAYQTAFQNMDSARSLKLNPIQGIYWAKRPLSYFWTASDSTSSYKAYFYPRGNLFYPFGWPGRIIANELRNVKCHYTSNGTSMTTTIRIAMLAFTRGRQAIASQLASLAKNGCSVNMLYYSGKNRDGSPTVDPSIPRSLLSAGVDAVPCTHKIPTLHTKIMMIDGMFNNKAQRLVYTGSDNFSTLANSDDTTLRITGNKVHQQYLKWINNMHEVCAYQGGTPPPGIGPTS